MCFGFFRRCLRRRTHHLSNLPPVAHTLEMVANPAYDPSVVDVPTDARGRAIPTAAMRQSYGVVNKPAPISAVSNPGYKPGAHAPPEYAEPYALPGQTAAQQQGSGVAQPLDTPVYAVPFEADAAPSVGAQVVYMANLRATAGSRGATSPPGEVYAVPHRDNVPRGVGGTVLTNLQTFQTYGDAGVAARPVAEGSTYGVPADHATLDPENHMISAEGDAYYIRRTEPHQSGQLLYTDAASVAAAAAGDDEYILVDDDEGANQDNRAATVDSFGDPLMLATAPQFREQVDNDTVYHDIEDPADNPQKSTCAMIGTHLYNNRYRYLVGGGLVLLTIVIGAVVGAQPCGLFPNQDKCNSNGKSAGQGGTSATPNLPNATTTSAGVMTTLAPLNTTLPTVPVNTTQSTTPTTTRTSTPTSTPTSTLTSTTSAAGGSTSSSITVMPKSTTTTLNLRTSTGTSSPTSTQSSLDTTTSTTTVSTTTFRTATTTTTRSTTTTTRGGNDNTPPARKAR